MQIKKINDNKLKIILNTNDLNEKHVDIDSFLANPIESQNLFIEILDLAEKKYHFDFSNNKAIIETISLDDNIFILTITRLSNETNITNNNLKIYCFENTNDILSLYSFISKSNIHIPKLEIYNFSNKYYIVLNESNYNFENILLEFSISQNNYYYKEELLKEYGKTYKFRE